MKIFLDTADLEKIRKISEYGIVDGVTTNPTLISRENKDPERLIKNICKAVDGPVNIEVISSGASEMIKEGEKYASWSPNIVVKIPMTREGIKAVRSLSAKGINTNVTLVFSSGQALIAAKAGAKYVSPFIGRLDDIAFDGLKLVGEIVKLFNNY